MASKAPGPFDKPVNDTQPGPDDKTPESNNDEKLQMNEHTEAELKASEAELAGQSTTPAVSKEVPSFISEELLEIDKHIKMCKATLAARDALKWALWELSEEFDEDASTPGLYTAMARLDHVKTWITQLNAEKAELKKMLGEED